MKILGGNFTKIMMQRLDTVVAEDQPELLRPVVPFVKNSSNHQQPIPQGLKGDRLTIIYLALDESFHIMYQDLQNEPRRTQYATTSVTSESSPPDAVKGISIGILKFTTYFYEHDTIGKRLLNFTRSLVEELHLRRGEMLYCLYKEFAGRISANLANLADL